MLVENEDFKNRWQGQMSFTLDRSTAVAVGVGIATAAAATTYLLSRAGAPAPKEEEAAATGGTLSLFRWKPSWISKCDGKAHVLR
jgi:hypothetical protein